ncbi:HlyD family type I secretion periplasmic adaptor subunit [Halomonas salifodinae]|uniref:HlyD family type I secretion periplasmic adaptor subunit n=1 Tax=Halomonas salifodinae TaxID=438745 RepID=UPI0033B49660
MAEHKPTLEQRGFERIGRLSEGGGKPFRPLIDRLFSRWVSSAHLNRDWASDADWARMQQEPLRARAFLYLVVMALVGLVIWATLAQIDEVTKGDGRIIPSSQLQRVQSYDGGVVQEILVAEGQRVEAGQLLMRIDPTRYASSFRENQARVWALQARAERLRALVADDIFRPSPDLVAQAPDLVERERELYEGRRAELREQESIVRERLTQRREELNEARARFNAASRDLGLASQELNMTQPLLQSGAVSEVEVIRLRREVSRASGERSQASAQVSRLEAGVEEAQAQLREITLERRGEWRNELAQTMGELSALEESSTGLEDRVRLAELRAPVSGIVQRLHVTTLGGVAQPGQDVVEIVPTDDQLLVEARIAPQDIAFLRPGQEAFIKLTAYDFTIFGGLDAQLEHISADTITDDNGNTFYLVRVRTQEATLAPEMPIIPGMTAQVDIRTGQRTIMEYLLKPVLRGMGNAMTER